MGDTKEKPGERKDKSSDKNPSIKIFLLAQKQEQKPGPKDPPGNDKKSETTKAPQQKRKIYLYFRAR